MLYYLFLIFIHPQGVVCTFALNGKPDQHALNSDYVDACMTESKCAKTKRCEHLCSMLSLVRPPWYTRCTDIEDDSQKCPKGFEFPHGKSCYRFEAKLIPRPKLTWKLAWKICTGMEAHLAAIESIDEQAHLTEVIRANRDLYPPGGRFRTPSWIWESTGKKLRDTYANWEVREPGVIESVQSPYLGLSSGGSFKWVNYALPRIHWQGFICEKPIL